MLKDLIHLTRGRRLDYGMMEFLLNFYKIFWNSVGELMTEVFNYSFELGQMSNSQKQAIITLIDKKGRDRMFLENWRPVPI